MKQEKGIEPEWHLVKRTVSSILRQEKACRKSNYRGSPKKKTQEIVYEKRRSLIAGTLDYQQQFIEEIPPELLEPLVVNLRLKCTSNLRIKVYHFDDEQYHQNGTTGSNIRAEGSRLE